VGNIPCSPASLTIAVMHTATAERMSFESSPMADSSSPLMYACMGDCNELYSRLRLFLSNNPAACRTPTASASPGSAAAARASAGPRARMYAR